MTLRIIDTPPKPEENQGRYITTYKPFAGWKAIEIWWNPDLGGFPEPWQTGLSGYETEAEAIAEAKFCAEAEDLPYLPRKEK